MDERGERIIKQEQEIKRPLTDIEWLTIAQPIKLPLEARPAIENAIKQFKRNKSEKIKTAAQLRYELKKLQKAAIYILPNLVDWEKKSNFWLLLFGSPISDHDAFRRMLKDIEGAINVLRRLSLSYPIYKAIPKKLKDTSTLNLRQFVVELGNILLQHTGKKITRSYKQPEITKYIHAAVKAVDPEIGNFSIDEAMKHVISLRQ